jgi:hypothetical protein
MDELSGVKKRDFGKVSAAIGRLIRIAAKAAVQEESV